MWMQGRIFGDTRRMHPGQDCHTGGEWWDAMKPLECHPDKVAAHNVAWATEELQTVNWVCNASPPSY